MNKVIAHMERMLLNRISTLNGNLSYAQRIGDLVLEESVREEIEEHEEALRQIRSPQ